MLKNILILFLFFSFSYADKNWIKIEEQDMIDTNKVKTAKDEAKYNPDIIEIMKVFSDPKKALNSEISNKFLKLDKEDEKISKDHKIVKTYYSNGKIKKSTSYLYSKKDGIQKEYYSNGKTMVKTYYLNNKKHGVETIYDESGKIHKTQFFRHGVLEN